MGYYINPPQGTKEAWLYANARKLSDPPDSFKSVDGKELAVCLVDNGMFTAAGCAYSQRELEAFASPDPRPKSWFFAPIDKLVAIVPGLGEVLKEEGVLE